MAVKIRLKRMGAKQRPFYRIVVAAEIKFDKDAAKKWISNGAQPTDTVRALFRKTGLLEEIHKEKISK